MVATSLRDSIQRHEPVRAPSEERADLAKLSNALRALDVSEPGCSLVGPNGEHIALSGTTFQLLMRVVEVLERGDAITLVPVHQELTTQQAADLLNVSRQYLVRLLDDGKIPYTRTGTHRRVRIDHVLAYKRERDRDRRESLNELARLSEEFGGYDEFE